MTTRAKEIRELGNTSFLELDANGNVGIGTTNPSTLLDVRGKVSVAYDSGNHALRLYNQSRNNWSSLSNMQTNNSADIVFKSGTGSMTFTHAGSLGIGATSPVSNHKMTIKETASENASIVFTDTDDMIGAYVGMARGTDQIVTGATSIDLVLGTAYTADTHLIANNAIGLTLKNGGNVGIGTTNPSYPIHIKGTGHQRLKIEKTDSGGDADISITGPSDSIGWVLFTDNTAGSNSGAIKYVHSTNKMHFRTDDNDDQLVISSDGNVGFGHGSPSAPIDVITNSNVYAAEFTQSNTANGDGVFISVGSTAAADYALTVRSDAGNTSVLAAKADGTVGIGVFTPSAKLHVKNTAVGNAVYIDNDFGWTAANLSEFSNSAFTIRPRQADVYLKTSGSSNDVRFQAINNANDTAHDIKLNPFGGRVGVRADGNLTAAFTVNKPATGHTTGYQEDIAQLYTTETSYLGRHYMNFFHDNNNRDASGHHTVWGMAFGYDTNTRGGIQYDHKGNERMTLWSSYGTMQFKVPTTAASTHKAHTLTEDPVLELKNNGNNMRPRQSAICLTLPSSQGWSQGNSWIKVNLTSVVYQKGVSGAWDSGNGRYVCPETGLYLCTTSVQLENNSGSIWRYLFPCINGSTTSGVNGMNFADFVPQDSPNATYYHHAHTCILRCNSGDYIEWKMTGSGGGSTIKPGGETACCVYFMG